MSGLSKPEMIDEIVELAGAVPDGKKFRNYLTGLKEQQLYERLQTMRGERLHSTGELFRNNATDRVQAEARERRSEDCDSVARWDFGQPNVGHI